MIIKGFLTIILSGLLAQVACADVRDVRIWPEPDKTRIVFDLTQSHDYKAFELTNPSRIVLDINSADMLKSLEDINLADTPVRSIRSARRNSNDIRIVLDLKDPIQAPETFLLAPNDVYGYRLVVDLLPKTKTAVLSAPVVVKKADNYVNARRDLIIAIDAGHGGEDPGAIGVGRVMEKQVVLAIAKELHQLLQKTPGYAPLLVRNGDYFLGLRERRDKARQAKADFFVSIHADAFNVASASGGSVFTLSERGASSITAAWLATKENDSDLIGGYKLEDRDADVQRVLIDLSMTQKQTESRLLGQYILNEMGRITKLHKNQVEEAGFAVLKAPDVPSLLVETGFISNPQEARLLSNQAHQRKIARAIYNGITDYFRKYPPDGVPMGAGAAAAAQVYVVRKGDSLSLIATRQGVALQDLRQLNNLSKDALKVGQRLLIPSS